MTPSLIVLGAAATATVAAALKLRERRRAVATIAAELRHPLLYVPLTISSTRRMKLARRLKLRIGGVRPGVVIESGVVPATGSDPSVHLVTYQRPTRSRGSAALVWIHGGGTVVGDARQGDAWCSRVADDLDTFVVNVEYRLAPENPYPAALDDCYRTLVWLHENAAELGVDPTRIAVGGESAGAGLAAVLTQRANDTGVPVCFQLLCYPMLDDRAVLRTDLPQHRITMWSPASNRFAWSAYLGHEPNEGDDRPYISAARRTDLAGLPPAWIGVGDLDLFHAEDVEYARRLNEAGVACDLYVVPGMYHLADYLLDGKSPKMTAFRDSMLSALRTATSK